MLLTTNSDYTVFTIQSDNLTDFTDIDTVTLTAKINCGTTVYSDTIVEGDVTLSTGTFTVDLTTLFGSTLIPLADSIYSFTLTILNDDNSIIYEHSTVFVDNDTRCLVADCVKNYQNLELQLDYWTLSRASGCSGCDPTMFCNIYQRVTNGLAECQDC